MKKVGRVGLKALIYFEVLTTIALIVGLIVINTLQPGAGMGIDVRTTDTKAIQGFVVKSKDQSTLAFLMDITPVTVIEAFAQGEILQVLFFSVLFFSVLFAFGLQALGERGKLLLGAIDQASRALFGIVGINQREDNESALPLIADVRADIRSFRLRPKVKSPIETLPLVTG